MSKRSKRLEPLFAPWLTDTIDEMEKERGCTCVPFLAAWSDETSREGVDVYGRRWRIGLAHGMTLCHEGSCSVGPKAHEVGPHGL